MIDSKLIERCRTALALYRGDGRGGDILFDGRDRGNYLSYHLDDMFEMLSRMDPTGLAAGAMLNEMIEATIQGSTVRLDRVLREEGFVKRLRWILDIKHALNAAIDTPMRALMHKVNTALASTSSESGKCSSREVAICLRDAVYALDKGLTMRWLVCDAQTEPSTAGFPLASNITWQPDIASFVSVLRTDLSPGAHLARIGTTHTAIGLKQPGRVAYLSSLSLTPQGKVIEDRARGHHLAEALDIGTPMERYPDWITSEGHSSFDRSARIIGADQLRWKTVAELPRDRLIWLAMVVEIAGQRMLGVDPALVELSESLTLALPAPMASGDPVAPTGSAPDPARRLPAEITPNWTVADINLPAILADLAFSTWEIQFLRPALAGRSADQFLPLGDTPMMMSVDTGELRARPSDMELNENRPLEVEITPMSPGWAGTRTETEGIRRRLMAGNLARYLLAWGNRRFQKEWDASKPWMLEKLKNALPEALLSECATFREPGFSTYRQMHLYDQSPRHKTYNARCYFAPMKGRGAKTEVTHVAHFQPRHSADLVQVLGLTSEQELPEYLRGWRRKASWACIDRHQDRAAAPVDISSRWGFAIDEGSGASMRVEMSVAFNLSNVPQQVATAIMHGPADSDGPNEPTRTDRFKRRP